MAELSIEMELKQYILTKYKSIRAFTQEAEIPYSTFDTMIKRGISGTGVNTVTKICKTLEIDLKSLADGKIEPLGNKSLNNIVYINSEKNNPILELRVESGLSVKEFAESVGVSEALVEHWERGVISPNHKDIINISKAFNVDIYDLLPDEAGVKFADVGLPSVPVDSTLFANYQKLNKLGREKLIEYSEDLVNNNKYMEK